MGFLVNDNSENKENIFYSPNKIIKNSFIQSPTKKKRKQEPQPLLTLPLDILRNVISYLAVPDFVKFEGACRYSNETMGEYWETLPRLTFSINKVDPKYRNKLDFVITRFVYNHLIFNYPQSQLFENNYQKEHFNFGQNYILPKEIENRFKGIFEVCPRLKNYCAVLSGQQKSITTKMGFSGDQVFSLYNKIIKYNHQRVKRDLSKTKIINEATNLINSHVTFAAILIIFSSIDFDSKHQIVVLAAQKGDYKPYEILLKDLPIQDICKLYNDGYTEYPIVLRLASYFLKDYKNKGIYESLKTSFGLYNDAFCKNPQSINKEDYKTLAESFFALRKYSEDDLNDIIRFFYNAIPICGKSVTPEIIGCTALALKQLAKKESVVFLDVIPLFEQALDAFGESAPVEFIYEAADFMQSYDLKEIGKKMVQLFEEVIEKAPEESSLKSLAYESLIPLYFFFWWHQNDYKTLIKALCSFEKSATPEALGRIAISSHKLLFEDDGECNKPDCILTLMELFDKAIKAFGIDSAPLDLLYTAGTFIAQHELVQYHAKMFYAEKTRSEKTEIGIAFKEKAAAILEKFIEKTVENNVMKRDAHRELISLYNDLWRGEFLSKEYQESLRKRPSEVIAHYMLKLENCKKSYLQNRYPPM